MSLLGAFLSSAGSAYMKDKEETRKMEAELLKAKKLEEFRRETNRMDAEMRNKFAMDRQVQADADAIARQVQADAKALSRITEQGRITAANQAAKDQRALDATAENRRRVSNAVATAEEGEELRRYVDDETDPEFAIPEEYAAGLLGSVGSDKSERELVVSNLARVGLLDEAKTYADATKPGTSKETWATVVDVSGNPIAQRSSRGKVAKLPDAITGKGKGEIKVGGWSQKDASKYFTTQAWRVIGEGVDEYGLPIGEVTEADKARVRQMAAEATQEWINLEGKSDPTMIAHAMFGEVAAPVDTSVEDVAVPQWVTDQAVEELNKGDKSLTRYFDAYDTAGDESEKRAIRMKEREIMQREGVGTAAAPPTVVEVKTPADVEALPSGTKFRGPDGVVRVKP